jgi:hypothetical protein
MERCMVSDTFWAGEDVPENIPFMQLYLISPEQATQPDFGCRASACVVVVPPSSMQLSKKAARYTSSQKEDLL